MKETVIQLQKGHDTVYGELRAPDGRGDARDADDDGFTITELEDYDGTEKFVVTRGGWSFGLGGMSTRPLGVVVELLNYAEHGMDEPVEGCYETHPWCVDLLLIAAKPAKVTAEYDLSALGDVEVLQHVVEYWGGVPIAHIAIHDVRSSAAADGSAEYHQWLDSEGIDTMVHNIPVSHGVVFVQGRTHERFVMFRTAEDARRAAMWLVKNRCPAICGMPAFFLDRPINMVGETGWDVLRRQCKPLRKKKERS